MLPPWTTVGSRPPASSRVATIEVVVVLPCVPPTATENCRRISSASISARRTNGRGLGVGALHLVADAQHDLGDAAHADAADADEVHGADVEGHGAARHGPSN